LHEVGSNNPDGIEIKAPDAPKDAKGHPLDGVPFHPYYTVHDIFGVCLFLLVFSAIIFFAPEGGGYFLEANNFIPANPLQTPAEIAPVWYFTPFYSMLRAVTSEMVYALMACVVAAAAFAVFKSKMRAIGKVVSVIAAAILIALMLNIEAKFWGVVVMASAVIILFFLPWLDRSPVKSIRYRPGWHLWIYVIFVIYFFVLGYIGTRPPTPSLNLVSQIGILFYFGFFLLMPWWSRLGEPKPVPARINYAGH
ncbi:MAG: cytochrome bc complex cytochrome b subunit, partial [Proteobacteria bacterium]|nr:cytochrome bc complex cytochrome b subunit [Pseudomonadota bacterium]